MNHFISSILNNTAIWCKQAQDTKTFQIANATSVVDGMPNIMYDIISTVKANQGIIKSFGDAMVRGNTALNASVAFITCVDGDMTPADWLAAASAITGTIGAFTSIAPPVAITLDGISFFLSLASMYYDVTHRGSNDDSNYHF